MHSVFARPDRHLAALARKTVRLSLLALVIMAMVAWPAQQQLGSALYAAGFACCALSGIFGGRVYERCLRAVPDLMELGGFVAAPPDVTERVLTLLRGRNPVPLRVYVPETPTPQFVLMVFRRTGGADVLINEQPLAYDDKHLRLMLGHEMGHLADPPRRAATRNDVVLLAWLLLLVHSGASVWLLAALYAARTVTIGLARTLESWTREVRADLYSLHAFNATHKLGQYFDTLEYASMLEYQASQQQKRSKRVSAWSIAAATAFIVLFPKIAVFFAVDRVCTLFFAFAPTHPPPAQRRAMASAYMDSAEQAS